VGSNESTRPAGGNLGFTTILVVPKRSVQSLQYNKAKRSCVRETTWTACLDLAPECHAQEDGLIALPWPESLHEGVELSHRYEA